MINLNDASRIIDIIDGRIEAKTFSEAMVETTWAEVASVSADHRSIEAFMYGETESDYASPGFRLPVGLMVIAGNMVRVAIDKDRGDRWVEEVVAASAYSTDYNRFEIDPTLGSIGFGGGSTVPTNYIRWDAANSALVLDDGALGDTNAWNILGELRLYRASGANFVLLTDPTNLNASNVAFAMKNTGEMQWGPSGAARDVSLYRSGTNQMYMEAKGGSSVNNPLFRLLSDASPASTDYTAFAVNRAGDVAARWVGGYMGDIGAVGIGLGPGNDARDVFLFRSSDGRLRVNGSSVDSYGSGDYAAFRWLDSSQNARWLMDYGTGTTNDLRVMYATGTTPSESAVEVSRWTYNDGAGPRILLGRTNAQVGIDGVISPTVLSADAHNWEPTNYDIVNGIRIQTDATPRTITGIVAPPNSGIFYWLYNVNSSTSVTLAHDSTSSTAANRFFCPNNANLTIRARGAVMVVYDGSSSRWRVIAP